MSPSDSTPIRLGFIGLSATGWASRDLVPPLLKEPLSSKYSLVALSTTRAESAEASAAKYSELASEAVGKKVAIKPYYGSAEHISADKDVDMVVVSVKLTSHKEAATKVIEAGKDLFLEWPAGNHREETIELYEAAKKKGIRTVLGFQMRFSHFATRAKFIIDNGEIGTEIVSTTLNVSSTTGPFLPEPWKYIVDPSTGGGGIIDIVAGHSLDTLTFLLGPITSLSATVKNHASSTIIIDSNNKPTGETIAHTKPTQYCVNGLLANGATFTAHFQTGVPEPDYHWVIQGEKRTIRVVDTETPSPSKPSLFDVPPILYLNGNKVELPAEENRSGLLWEAIAEGKKDSYATLEDAVKMKEILNAIARSSEDGKRIDL